MLLYYWCGSGGLEANAIRDEGIVGALGDLFHLSGKEAA